MPLTHGPPHTPASALVSPGHCCTPSQTAASQKATSPPPRGGQCLLPPTRPAVPSSHPCTWNQLLPLWCCCPLGAVLLPSSLWLLFTFCLEPNLLANFLLVKNTWYHCSILRVTEASQFFLCCWYISCCTQWLVMVRPLKYPRGSMSASP